MSEGGYAGGADAGDRGLQGGPPASAPPAPSEVLDPTQLDQALLVVVVRPDGSAFLSTADSVPSSAAGAWLRQAAEMVEAADLSAVCPDCAAGSHDSGHPPE